MIERTKYGKIFVYIFLGVCLVLFIMFYPVTTGNGGIQNVFGYLPALVVHVAILLREDA